MEAFIPEEILGIFHGSYLVGDVENPEMLLQNFRYQRNLVFIKADYPDADQIGNEVFDLIRLFITLKRVLVFAAKLLDALLFVFDPAFDFRDLTHVQLLEQRVDNADIGIFCTYEMFPVVVVIAFKCFFFLFKV